MTRSVAAKMGIRAGSRAIFVNAPETALAAIDPPEIDVAAHLAGLFDSIHLFTTNQKDLDAAFPTLILHLKPRGALWVSWPKGRQLGADLTLHDVIHIGYRHGLVESKSLSFDTTWSAIKFTQPVEGKMYNNRYG